MNLLQVFQITSEKDVPELRQGIAGFPTSYIGRVQEIEDLQSTLFALCEGQGQILAIMGEAGIGKTRPLEEVKSILYADDPDQPSTSIPPSSTRWLEERSLCYGGSLSYLTITQFLLLDLHLSDGTPHL